MTRLFFLCAYTNLHKVCSWSIYVLRSSGISQKSGALNWYWEKARKRNSWVSFVFNCSENHSIAHIFGTTSPIQVGFSAKCTSPNGHINKILKKWKSHKLKFGLISLDRITYGYFGWTPTIVHSRIHFSGWRFKT